MKYLKTLILMLFATNIVAQDKEVIDELSYCKHSFPVPKECSANSKYELTCDNFTIQWLYMNDQMLTSMPVEFVIQVESRLKKVKKEKINCVSLNTNIDGYKLTYKDGKIEKYKIIAFGIVNEQPVLINLGLYIDPTNNNKIPRFVRQILELRQ